MSDGGIGPVMDARHCTQNVLGLAIEHMFSIAHKPGCTVNCAARMLNPQTLGSIVLPWLLLYVWSAGKAEQS